MKNDVLKVAILTCLIDTSLTCEEIENKINTGNKKPTSEKEFDEAYAELVQEGEIIFVDDKYTLNNKTVTASEIINVLKSGSSTPKEVAEALKKDKEIIKTSLETMKAEGTLQSKGNGNAIKYFISEDMPKKEEKAEKTEDKRIELISKIIEDLDSAMAGVQECIKYNLATGMSVTRLNNYKIELTVLTKEVNKYKQSLEC